MSGLLGPCKVTKAGAADDSLQVRGGGGASNTTVSGGSPEPQVFSLLPQPPGAPPPCSQQALGSPGPFRGKGSTAAATPPLIPPLPPPPETGSAQTMAWNAPLSGPPEARPEPHKNEAAAATVPSSDERRAPGGTSAAERWGQGASSAPCRPHPSPTYRRHRPPWRLGSPAGSPGRSRQSGLVPRWPAGSGEPAQTPREPPPPPQRQPSALKRLSLRLPTAPPVGTAPRFDTAQSSPGPPVCSAHDAQGPFSWANQRARSRLGVSAGDRRSLEPIRVRAEDWAPPLKQKKSLGWFARL